jgi:hypothetical protein
VELNAQLHGLQGEVDELRAFAPDHQQCACHTVRYNRDYAERTDLRVSCAGAEVIREKSGQVSRCVVSRPGFSSQRLAMMMIVLGLEPH